MATTVTQKETGGQMYEKAYQVVFGADADFFNVDVKNIKSCSVQFLGISSDEMKVYFSNVDEPTSSDWQQWLDSTGSNPGVADSLSRISVIAKRMKIVRVGAVDGDITAEVILKP